MNIGQILIELGLNSAAFSKGLTTVSVQSQKTAKEISSAFSEIGGKLSEVLGALGPLGTAFGNAFSGASGAASAAAKAFSGLGGTVGLLATSVAATGGIFLAAGAGALGMAGNAAESAAKLHELSESTGVSVETLSRFGYIARQNGVDSDTMTKGLERLAKSAYQAAIAPQGTINVYTRMGVAVKDSTGAMRPLSDILGDVADKFKDMGPGTERTALAMQIFGRGGAAMLPVLAEGAEGIRKMSDEADQLGVTISGQTAQAAHQFEQSLDKVKEAGQGVQNQLMVQLLPAMQTVATQFVDALKDPESGLNSMITVLAFLAKVIISVGEVFVSVFGQAKVVIWGVISLLQEGFTGVADVMRDIMTGRFDLIATDAKKAGKNIVDSFKTSATDTAKVWTDTWKTLGKVWSDTAAPKGPAKTEGTGGDKKLLGGAVGSGAKAEKDIVEELISKLEAQVKAEDAVSSAIQGSAYALAIKKASADADMKIEETMNTLIHRRAQLEQEAAAAVGTKKSPQITSQLADVNKQIQELTKSEPLIRSLYEQLASDKEITKVDTAIQKQTESLQAEAAQYAILAKAAFGTAEAQREATAEAAAAKFAAENPELATQERLQVVYDNALKQQDLAYQKTILQSAAQDDLNTKYATEIERLNDVKAVLEANGKDTLVVDAKLYDAQRSINAEWDAAAIKVGNFKQVAAGTLDELAQKAENFGSTMSKSVIQAVDSSTSALSKFLVTGSKTNFKQIGQDFAENITSGLLKSGVSNIAKSILGSTGLGSLLPGSVAKADGSQTNPFFVSIVNGGGAIPGSSGGIGALISGGMFGGGGPAAPDNGGGGGGGFFSGLLGSVLSFLPGLAGGGDVMPGKAYMVGEDRPELFVPDRPGKIVPDTTKMNQGPTGLNASITMHVHGASNPDEFKRSSAQVAADLYRQLQAAHARNGMTGTSY